MIEDQRVPTRKATEVDKRLYILEVFITSGLITEQFAKENPVVARTIQIRGDQVLELLHEAIFLAFDRYDQHMYEFQLGGEGPMDPEARCYGLPGATFASEREFAGDVTRTTVGSLGLKDGEAFGYWFDFGDDWWHQINVLSVLDKAPRGKFPKVVARVGESPPQYVDWDAEEENPMADLKIDQVFEEFLADQRKRLKPRTLSGYENVVDLLRHHLNGYGHEYLSKAESALFDKYYNASGEEHREFCQLFGPDKIVENLGSFLNYFMIRKVVAGAELKRTAGTVTKKLAKWLVARGYISAEAGRDGVEEGADAVRKLPNAERATQILFAAADDLIFEYGDEEYEDYMDFDHFTIARIEPGKLWFQTYEEQGELGPVDVSEAATGFLEAGWDISCALGRIGGQWRIVEVANVYPG